MYFEEETEPKNSWKKWLIVIGAVLGGLFLIRIIFIGFMVGHIEHMVANQFKSGANERKNMQEKALQMEADWLDKDIKQNKKDQIRLNAEARQAQKEAEKYIAEDADSMTLAEREKIAKEMAKDNARLQYLEARQRAGTS